MIDGDTIVVSLNGEEERVRLVGIDTQKKGPDLVSSIVGLLEADVDDRDRYGRLLRYLEVDGIDPGLELIRTGPAEAAYDSRPGFPEHFREDVHISASESNPYECNDR